MGKGNDIIVHEEINDCSELNTGTVVKLANVKEGKLADKKLHTVAKALVERLLPYFIDQNYSCPRISISESDGSGKVVLNEYMSESLSATIEEIVVENGTLDLSGVKGKYEFIVRLFKFYSPKNQLSKISLVANRREVIGTPIYNYIPEFHSEFFDKKTDGLENNNRNYILKAYVFGSYLDENVSLERGGFEFQKDKDLLFGISQFDIEKEVAEISKSAVDEVITVRQEKKRERIKAYVDEQAPWHKSSLKTVDLSSMPYNPTREEMEMRLQKERYRKETEVTGKISRLINEGSKDDLEKSVNKLVSQISEASKDDLTHYIALRRNILGLFEKNLELDSEGSYSSEGAIHDIIFPRKEDSENLVFEDHNLWIIDERLNFSNYVSSDKPLSDEGNTDRPDLLAYDRRVLFRGDNEHTNPVTIFEFKKPQRDDFVNQSSREDPVQQIVRYVNQVRDGKSKTPKGRDILISTNTPFYGYVVCDLTPKVKKWLELEKDYKQMPDSQGWFKWHENINLYMEVISWDKVLQDAKMRNRIFFRKLGID